MQLQQNKRTERQMTYNKIFIRCSQHFLVEPIPENHLDLDDHLLDEWLENNSAEPFQHYVGSEIYKAIEQVAMDVQEIIKESI